MLWYLFAAIWVSIVHICNAMTFEDDIGRNVARKQLEDSRVRNRAVTYGRQGQFQVITVLHANTQRQYTCHEKQAVSQLARV